MEDANLEGISMKYILAIKDSGLVPSFAFSSQRKQCILKNSVHTLWCARTERLLRSPALTTKQLVKSCAHERQPH